MDVISRAEAKARGLKRYFTGKPCKHGHVAERGLANRACLVCHAEGKRTEKAREKARAYGRKWFKTNREKAREYVRKRRGCPEPTRPCPDYCECCGSPPGKCALHLDHCHTTGKFRGWLCGNCNTAIGKLGDDEAGLERALRYLRQNVIT